MTVTNVTWRLVDEVGSNTFSIMAHHYLGFFLLKCLFFAAHCLLQGFGLFDVEQFLTVYNYKYYPSGLTQFAAAYVAFGIAFSLAVHHAWLRARGWLRRRLGLAGPSQ